jgi:hypothetical protein
MSVPRPQILAEIALWRYKKRQSLVSEAVGGLESVEGLSLARDFQRSQEESLA